MIYPKCQHTQHVSNWKMFCVLLQSIIKGKSMIMRDMEKMQMSLRQVGVY